MNKNLYFTARFYKHVQQLWGISIVYINTIIKMFLIFDQNQISNMKKKGKIYVVFYKLFRYMNFNKNNVGHL